MSSAAQAANTSLAFQQLQSNKAQIENMNAQTAKIKSETMDNAVNTAARLAEIQNVRAQALSTEEKIPGIRADSARNLQRLDEERFPGSYPASAFAADVRERKARATLLEQEIPKGQAEAKFWDTTGPSMQYLRMFMEMLNGAGAVSRFVK